MKKLAIVIYMLAVKVIGCLARLFPVEQKVVFLISFEENPAAILKQMELDKVTPNTVVFYDPRLKVTNFSLDFLKLKPKNIAQFIPLMYHLNTAKVIVTDNYFVELAGVKLRHGASCIQIWHANGALKKFGWEDKAAQKRYSADKKRFQAVYKRFTNVVVGSDEMATIFQKSFLLDEAQMLKIGVPRTDYFFDEEKLKVNYDWTVKSLKLSNKKKLLYAPTFRDDELHSMSLHLDVAEMKRALGDEYQLILKLHPSISNDLEKLTDEFVVYADKETPIETLLPVVDILITDYSSIPFEFALLEKPMIFYTYDLQEYDKVRGLSDSFLETIPGNCAFTTAELVEEIKKASFDLEKVRQFALKWNKYSDGSSSERFVSLLKERLEK
ncbi:CDP-glycerol glycerophosphotransferase family protein [Listeria ivanovii]|uniref:Putative teichoic acid biosynthesis protein B n=1 Tax=Listeria ivanovii (strain ATCC BAA-678 / PAM 55) TaxID=881621 RepID=G2ZEK9_LISIP|nr:CDP-glycerol glycerophosphotransferase family protein [Listeria ivanovii]AHI55584.1 teichoic acid biosynthesis protein B [Listeria ivanovii WSLC3009]AIS65039.1 teichoic acid biosynthesis protein B [Listeria ivanovii subsp. ivanovii]MBC1758245.1 CDP-glycerol glycerophosphotransferase family protein [Listeria ivanovii]MBK3913122.1 CDP-glycerol glycerophosphotransferase family protein [Listeria ivanovii subsp. ivanovii]MBK3920761.1 CDP-glycerol glycerophosphotransferase family protein [Listeri